MLASLVLIGYAVLLLAVGIAASRSVRGSLHFYVGGRALGPGFVFSTLLAANIGAGSTVGATGLAYRDGLSAWWWVGSAGIGSMILAWTIGPRIWRIAQNQNLYTLGDYLELRFNRSVRGLAAALIWLGSLSILAGQFMAVAWILNVTLGLGKPLGCLVAAIITTTYFAAGGLHSSARVNVVQLAVKLAGFVLAIAFLWYAGRGSEWLHAAGASREASAAAYLDPFGIGATAILRYVLLLAPSFIVSPGILQKVFGARDLRAVRVGVSLNAAALLAFAAIPALMGAIARGQFPQLVNAEFALPTLLLKSLPLWLGGLLLGAVLSAELSAGDAVLFMLTTSLGKDLYQACFRPEADDRQLMRVTRATAVICGTFGALLGIVLPSVISALTVFYTLLTAALLLPLVAGLYTKRISGHAALATMIVSVATTFGAELATNGRGPWDIPSLVLGTAAAAAAMSLVTVLESGRPHRPIK
ncbi:MAG TPA: sodium:solute symporter family protein [Acidobacteriota bacterium]|nr:sodium:solute symporter family protein [Acidobacteriota bacterium]